MHEVSLAREILGAVLERVGDQPVRVREVRGWLAQDEVIALDSLQLHFDRLADGTPAAGARLALEVEHVAARCLDCGQRYLPDHHLTICDACGSTRGELLGRTGLGVTAIEVTGG